MEVTVQNTAQVPCLGFSLSFVVRPLEKADTGASSKNFEVIDLNEKCSLGE